MKFFPSPPYGRDREAGPPVIKFAPRLLYTIYTIYERTSLKSVDLFSLGAAGVVPGGERLRRSIASDAKLQNVAPPTPWQGSSRPARRKCLMQALAIVEVAVIKPWLEAPGRSRGKTARSRNWANRQQESSSAGSSNGVASLLALFQRFAARCKILGRIGPADTSGAEIRTAISAMPLALH